MLHSLRRRSPGHNSCITTDRYSAVLTGTWGNLILAAQAPDQHIRLALTRRTSGVRVPQRPPQSRRSAALVRPWLRGNLRRLARLYPHNAHARVTPPVHQVQDRLLSSNNRSGTLSIRGQRSLRIQPTSRVEARIRRAGDADGSRGRAVSWKRIAACPSPLRLPAPATAAFSSRWDG
jgi:hypothetical protein